MQVDPFADSEVITAAYKQLAFKHHPDRNKSLDATKRMQEINEAYTVLGNDQKRREYDAQIGKHTYSGEDLFPEKEIHRTKRRTRNTEKSDEYNNSDDLTNDELRDNIMFPGLDGYYYFENNYFVRILRFYSDGLVLIKSLPKDSFSLKKNYRINRFKGKSYEFSGSYWLSENQIEFSTNSPEGPVEFKGEFQGNVLHLSIHKLKTGTREETKAFALRI